MTHPGYDGASDWFGMQSWTADRLAQYYYLTGKEHDNFYDAFVRF